MSTKKKAACFLGWTFSQKPPDWLRQRAVVTSPQAKCSSADALDQLNREPTATGMPTPDRLGAAEFGVSLLQLDQIKPDRTHYPNARSMAAKIMVVI